MRQKINFFSRMFLTVLLSVLPFVSRADTGKPAVADVSGVKYYATSTEMLAQAVTHAVLTLPAVEHDHAEFLELIKAVEMALRRGVRIEIFVNVQYSIDGWVWLTKAFSGYTPEALTIYPVAANHFRFHRLVVIDDTRMLEGALDWSKDRGSELDVAEESDDAARASAAVQKLRNLPHAGSVKTTPDAPQWRSVLCGMPPMVDRMTLPAALVTDRQFIPEMATGNDIEAFRATMLLYAACAYAKAETVQIDLERLALGIGAPLHDGKPDVATAKAVVIRLSKKYRLCTIGKKPLVTAMEVTLVRPQGETFALPIDIADPQFLAETPYSLTMGFVMECYFRSITATSR